MFKFVYYLVYIFLFPIYRFHFVGREQLPEGRCVLCANHTANIDGVLLVLANGAKGNHGIIGKAELFRFQPLGWLLSRLGVFPVKRGSGDLHAIKTGLSVLKEEKRLLLFPEGTRVKPGMKSEPKSGAALFAVRGNAPLVPVYIPAGRKAFRRNMVVIGKPYQPQVEGKPDQQQYMQITCDLMERIRALGPEARNA